MRVACFFIALGAIAACADPGPAVPDIISVESRQTVSIPRVDGTAQPAVVMIPAGTDLRGVPRPLLVSLHGWGGDVTWRDLEMERAAMEAGWIYLWPDFRGPNFNTKACGSELAQYDILEAVSWAETHLPVDPRRVYLTGTSGGGHMALLMAGRTPSVWAAVSAWASITDLAQWYQDDTLGYRMHLEACTGGAPGSSSAVDAQYRARSPVTWLAAAAGLPVDIAAGIRDGHPDSTNAGTVPINQSLIAFNVLARATNAAEITPAEMNQLMASPLARLSAPKASDLVTDPSFGREIVLRRAAGRSRVTIFEGGHEGIAGAAIAWLRQFHR